MAHATVTSIDNRGTAECPFGFVNLSDGSRVGFGSNRDNPKPLAIWSCRETRSDISGLTIYRVRDALAKRFSYLVSEEVP